MEITVLARNHVKSPAPKAAIRPIATPRRRPKPAIATANNVVGIKTAHYARKGYTALERAVEAGRLGSWTYLSKPLDFDQLEFCMRSAEPTS